MFHLKLLLYTLLLWLLEGNCLQDGKKCYSTHGFGTCIQLWECQHLVTEIMIAGYPMPSYMNNKLHQLICGYHEEHPLVCCAGPRDVITANPRAPDTQNSNTTFNKTESTDRGARIADIHNHPNLRLLPTNCGSGIADRITGGKVAELFEMPWMVLLSYQSVIGTDTYCDGTLINEWYVLTAAHCVAFLPYGLELKHVILGEYDRNQNPDCDIPYYGIEICAPPIKTVAVADVIVHSGYNNQYSLTDDIALIRLSEAADFSLESVQPICLPVTSELQTEKLVGLKNSTVAGWGKTEQGLKSSQLLKVDLPIVSKEECQVAYEGKAVIHDQHLCAGGIKNKDSCGGDSGGPLTYPGLLQNPGPVRNIQRGIVSFGHQECGKAGFPGVYTNVAYYMDWILDHIHS